MGVENDMIYDDPRDYGERPPDLGSIVGEVVVDSVLSEPMDKAVRRHYEDKENILELISKEDKGIFVKNKGYKKILYIGAVAVLSSLVGGILFLSKREKERRIE